MIRQMFAPQRPHAPELKDGGALAENYRGVRNFESTPGKDTGHGVPLCLLTSNLAVNPGGSLVRYKSSGPVEQTRY